MKQVLWLCSWFPNRLNAFEGDPIERLAFAAAAYNNITLLFVKKDPTLPAGKTEIVTEQPHPHLKIIKLYYGVPTRWGALVAKTYSTLRYYNLFIQQIKKHIAENGLPNGIQVNVAMKAGLPAVWAKQKFNLPFIIVERNGWFLPEANPNYRSTGFINKWLYKKVYKDATAVVSVSAHLATYIKQCFHRNAIVVPNVVDTDTFFPAATVADGKFHCIHISSLDYPKNPELLLEAFALAYAQNPNLVLQVYGPQRPALENQCRLLNITGAVHFYAEATHPQLSKALQQAHALILCSRYESFGIVVIEAQACGLPVIVSTYKVFEETVQPNITGLVVENYNASALASAILQLAANPQAFNKDSIAAITKQKFGYATVAQQLTAIYQQQF
jgi:glycosyltransferase involved in cell wall biosynthesis